MNAFLLGKKIVFIKIAWKYTKLPKSSLCYFKVKNPSFHMPQTRVQYLCKFLCNRKKGFTEFVSVHESGGEVIKSK